MHEAAQMFMMVDHVWEMTVKKSCKYGEYGSFKHLLFLLSLLPVSVCMIDTQGRESYLGEFFLFIFF